MTDLKKFIDLYKSFDIEIKTNISDEDNEGNIEIYLTSSGVAGYNKKEITSSEKLIGYLCFYSIVLFDNNGKFISQGFYEYE